MAKKTTKWELADYVKTEDELIDYLWACLECFNKEHDRKFLWISCEDVAKIARMKGWL